jgi:transketolase
MLTESWHAAELLVSQGVEVTLINHPFPTLVDSDYLWRLVEGAELVVTVDDHYKQGALGSAVAEILTQQGGGPAVLRHGLNRIPDCGTPVEVLNSHALDRESLARSWLDALALSPK